jgi:hypothetical protein
MEWMVDNCPDPAAVTRAIDALNTARGVIEELRIHGAATQPVAG